MFVCACITNVSGYRVICRWFLIRIYLSFVTCANVLFGLLFFVCLFVVVVCLFVVVVFCLLFVVFCLLLLFLFVVVLFCCCCCCCFCFF